MKISSVIAIIIFALLVCFAGKSILHILLNTLIGAGLFFAGLMILFCVTPTCIVLYLVWEFFKSFKH